MIEELLNTGRENTRTGRELAAELRCDLRTVVEMVEKERRDGKPICAVSKGAKPGYYIAEYKEDAESYCESLKHRAIAIFTTMHAVEKAAGKLPSLDAETTQNPNKTHTEKEHEES